MPSDASDAPDAPSVTTMYRLDSPHVVQGEVIWTDETAYVVRDFTGRDIRLLTNSATRVHRLPSMWIRLLSADLCSL
jgi:hypothetical protein